MLRINFDYFPDENNGFKRCHASLLLKKEEGVHQWPDHVWNCLRIELCDLIDAFDQEVPIFICAWGTRLLDCLFPTFLILCRWIIHLAGLEDFLFEERSNFFDISLICQVCNKLKHFLVYLNRLHCILTDNVENVAHVVFEQFGIPFLQL